MKGYFSYDTYSGNGADKEEGERPSSLERSNTRDSTELYLGLYLNFDCMSNMYDNSIGAIGIDLNSRRKEESMDR